MAKPKHSALFELISRDKPLTKQKRPGIIQLAVNLFRPPSKSVVGAAPLAGRVMAPADAREIAPSAGPALAPGERRVCVDPEQRQIGLRLTYTAVAIIGLALVTAIATAYMAGQKSIIGWSPRPVADAMTSDERQQEPANPSVLDLSSAGRNEPVAQRTSRIEASVTSTGAPAPSSAAQAVRNRKRMEGLNYVIVQSYPGREMAAEAVEMLAQNGVDATVEKSLPGWSTGKTSWYSVVGVDGFSRLSTAEYRAYVAKINELSKKFAKDQKFKEFQPTAYKWKK